MPWRDAYCAGERTGGSGAVRGSACGRCCRAATTTRCTTRTPPSLRRRRRRAATSPGGPTPACRRSRRSPTAATGTSRTGTATSSTTAERERGLDYVEDLASPGVFAFDLARPRRGPGAARRRGLAVAREPAAADLEAEAARRAAARAAAAAGRRRLRRATAATARTIIAGFPWFTDWGRDTFIALRGLVLAPAGSTRREAILLAWAGTVSEGMLPNRFPDRATRRSTTRSTPRSGSWSRCTTSWQAARGGPGRRRRARRRSRAAVDGNPRRLRGRHALRHRARRGRPAARRRAGRAAHLDGRQGRRLGGDAAHRQAGRGPGAVAQRARASPARCVGRAGASLERARARRLRSALLRTRAGGACYDVVDADHVPGQRPIPRSGRTRSSRSAACPSRCWTSRGARAWSTRSSATLLTPLGLRSLAPATRLRRPRYRGGPRASATAPTTRARSGPG